MTKLFARSVCLFLLAAVWVSPAQAQTTPAPAATAGVASAPLPPGYVIGPEDVLSVIFWRDTELSSEVVVRPDGRISLPLLKDIPAAGYTPEQLSGVVEQAATKFIADPDATVIVKEVRSRKVFVLGEVNRQGTVALTREMNVMQVLAEAGGLLEYADKDNIIIVRQEDGKERRFRFNYSDVVRGRNVQQNIMLQPGDMVLVQ